MKIIGFRSNKSWKKILATIGYFMILSVLMVTFVGCNSDVSSKTIPTVAQEQKVEEIQKDRTEAEMIKEEIPVVDSTPIVVPVVTPEPEVKNEVTEKPKENTVTQNTSQANSEVIVYRGNTGTKYHKSGCRTLKNGQIEMTLSEAKSMGLGACKVCNP